ncbi:MAG TPA: FAD-binding oxidoreductase [Bryobacteraceae bacterium]
MSGIDIEDLRVVEPKTEEEVSEMLRCADRDGVAVIPRGGGTKLAWGNPPARAGLILSTACLNRIVEHAWADLTVTVEAGCRFAELQRALATHGQRLALDPLWPETATIGGILSTNDSGVWRLAYGGLRDLILGITLVLADGTIARSGGKVVKNVAGYDLPKLATGALGTLGVIMQTTFRLHPLPRNTRMLTLVPADLAEAQALLLRIQDTNLAHTALQVRAEAGKPPEMDILLEGTEAGIAAQRARIAALAGPAQVAEAADSVWLARQQIANRDAVAKCSVLPARIANAITAVEHAGDRSWRAVFQATGLGWISVDAPLEPLRAEIESQGGTLTVLRQSPGRAPIDAWGDPGDTLPLMRSIKQRFDTKSTLNPGRFVGGI